MDYVVLSTIQHSNGTPLLLSYDIVCQWHKHFGTRMEAFPSNLRIPQNISITYGIPKCHIEGHGMECKLNYSLNLLPGAGRTCGEQIEQEWSMINPVATSTREMTPAGREDTLNDHWGGLELA